MSYIIISLFFTSVYCELTTESVETILHTYSQYINSSHSLDKNDQQILRSWSRSFQTQQVDIAADYRLDMMRHREHTFQWTDSAWRDCIATHRSSINATDKLYYDAEGKCLNESNARVGTKRRTVNQMKKEIKKWRKTYRYLENLCKKNFPGDDESAGNCLVDYMKRDNYDVTFQRLILLKLDAMSSLFSQIQSSLHNLAECLRVDLAEYLNRVRSVMESLNQCYKLKKRSNK